MRAACSSSAGTAWLYVSRVMAMLACPSRSWTTLGWTPDGQGQGGVGVTKVMQADDRQVGRKHVAGEGSGDLPRVERPAVLSGEHQA